MMVSSSDLSSSSPPSTPSSSDRSRSRLTSSSVALPLLIAALIYFVAHVLALPPALEDIDSVNFALGLRDFDPTQHHPHPPGYPVYIALGKVSRAVIGVVAPSMEAQARDARALSWWSATGGAISIVASGYLLLLLMRLARSGMGSDAGLLAAVMLAASPLFWLSGLRPLSDMPGLAVALVVQALTVHAMLATRGGDATAVRRLAVAGLSGGLAIGVRSQLLWLVAPLLLVAVVYRGDRRAMTASSMQWFAWRGVVAGMSFTAGALMWAVPLVAASGGVDPYLAALRVIAGEDFSEVRMLWTHPSARTLSLVLYNTLIRPWGHQTLAIAVLLPALAASLWMLARERRLVGWIALAFGPYAVFHFLFQDSAFTRYALPLVVPVTWLAARGLMAMSSQVARAGVAALAVASLWLILPVGREYAAMPMPVSGAIAGAAEGLAKHGGVVAGHFEFARALSVSDVPPASILPAQGFSERLALASYFAGGGQGPVWFVAAPRRTDLMLIDPNARHLLVRSEWRFSRDWFMGGTRPDYGELVRIDVPGWIAGEGWHLTREEIILSDRRGNPTPQMFVRRRGEEALLFIGGDYLTVASGRAAELVLTIDGRALATLPLPAGQPQFFHQLVLPPTVTRAPSSLLLSSSSTATFANLEVAVRATDGGVAPRVQLTQFDLQPPDRFFWVYSHGWHDREWDAKREREWRWTSERASVRVHTPGRDVQIQIDGEVPVPALGGPANVSIEVGRKVIARWRADGRFSKTLRVPAADLDAVDGLLEIATDRTFVPGGSGGDQRRLGVQVYELGVHPVEARLTRSDPDVKLDRTSTSNRAR